MKTKNILEIHDCAALVALLLEDPVNMRVQVIIDDGTATVAQGANASVFDSHLPDVIDGNSEALLYVPDTFKTIKYLDADYNEQPLAVSPQVIYAFRLVNGEMKVEPYAGPALRRLLIGGM